MAKHRLKWDEEKIKRFLKEGRGQGEGSEYKPWLTVQDFPSKGRVSRTFGWKTKRIHHLFTDTQTKYFYLLEWEDSVVDIREHYPILNIEEVIQDNKDLNFNLFTDRESGTPYILSTSFLITLRDTDGMRYAARSIKSITELEKKLTLERLEIERRFWESKGIGWGIVTQKDIPSGMAKNIEWVHSSLYSYTERGFTEEDMIDMCRIFSERIINNQQSIRKIAAEFDAEYNYDSGTGLFLFKHLIASKRIKVDMTKEININSLNLINIKAQKLEKEGSVVCL